MDLRARNNLIIMITLILMSGLMFLSALEYQRNKSRRPAGPEPAETSEKSVLSLAIESILTEEGMLDSLAGGTAVREPTALSPAESLLIETMSESQRLPADSVRREYLRIRWNILKRGSR